MYPKVTITWSALGSGSSYPASPDLGDNPLEPCPRLVHGMGQLAADKARLILLGFDKICHSVLWYQITITLELRAYLPYKATWAVRVHGAWLKE